MLNKGTLLFLLSMNLVLRGAEQAPSDSEFKPVDSIADVGQMIGDDDLSGLKEQVDAGLNVQNYTFQGKPLFANWPQQRAISALIYVRSPEMVDFLVSQGLDAKTQSQGFKPLESALGFQGHWSEHFDENIDEKDWKSVFRYLKMMATIDRLRELGAIWPEDWDYALYESDRKEALDKVHDMVKESLTEGTTLPPELIQLIAEFAY